MRPLEDSYLHSDETPCDTVEGHPFVKNIIQHFLIVFVPFLLSETSAICSFVPTMQQFGKPKNILSNKKGTVIALYESHII